MDRNALDWLFSTTPQALAALVGLIFAGVSFIVGAINKQMDRDDSQIDICMAMKERIHNEMKWLYWLSGSSIILDLLFLIMNPIEEGVRFSLEGSFSPYLLFSGLTFLLNIVTLIYALWFIINVTRPSYFDETVKRLSGQEQKGDVEVKEYLMEYIELEKALRDLPMFRAAKGGQQLPVSVMLRELKFSRLIDAHDVDNMIALTRLRNLIMHGADIEYVERSMYDNVKTYTKVLKELKKKL